MDVVTTTYLEALIEKATNPQNQKADLAAIEAFCVTLSKAREGPQVASKLLATQIQSNTEWVALQALNLLDVCMKRCGRAFHAEIGKFRFLNEMIKLVSPKYQGNSTPEAVNQKILQLLYNWTRDYPRETKIKEAYEMLRKQGVIKEEAFANVNNVEDNNKSKIKNTTTIFDDEAKSKLLEKLLQSKNPDDLQAANRLIKTMVKEDEKRIQQNSRRTMELESVHNNAKLLSEMLDTHDPKSTSSDDLELMKEVYQACERLRPIILRLANETLDNAEMLTDVRAASDELSQVLDKYVAVIVLGQPANSKLLITNNGPSLLDLSTPLEELAANSQSGDSNDHHHRSTRNDSKTDMEVLGDIFNSLSNPSESTLSSTASSLMLPDAPIMQPIGVPLISRKSLEDNCAVKVIDSKAKALEDLNELGETLLKQSLSSSLTKGRLSNSNNADKTLEVQKSPTSLEMQLGDNNSAMRNSSSAESTTSFAIGNFAILSESDDLNGDDSLVDITIDVDTSNDERNSSQKEVEEAASTANEIEVKPLTDLNVKLENIKPGTIPPLTVIDERNGITVVLHVAKDSPRPDVTVVVVTTMSKSPMPLTNYLFQAVVPKRCKCRLQAPSGSELPAHNPFLPPPAITQIMLIANPYKDPVSLKCMLSYTMDDETVTEMGEVDRLPTA